MPTSCLFEEPWWLDAVAPGAWDAVTVEKKGRVVGRLPYVMGKRAGMSAILSPPLTPTLGPWVEQSKGTYTRRLTQEMKIVGELFDALPAVSAHYQQLTPSLMSTMPLHWRGYTATPRYTYRIHDLSDLDAVRAGFTTSARGWVKKAEKQYEVRDDRELDVLLRLSAQSLERSGAGGALSEDLVRRVDAALAERGQRRLLVAEDSAGDAHAAVYLAWDSRCLYQLIAGHAAESRGGGAPSLLHWEAMKFASGVAEIFDCEGSMLPGVEQFFRSFGGQQQQYFAISKESRWLKPVSALRNAIRAGSS